MTSYKEVIDSLATQFKPVLDSSPDGVYIWLDEVHKVCNERLARMFGYTVEEWCSTAPFLETFVAPEDRELYSYHYQTRVAQFLYPVTFRFRGLRKDGTSFAAETDMIPISSAGQPVAYHFVRKLGE
jgi:PAS domain S-box-containing protein